MRQLDATDMRIIQKLREDGRRPYRAIAKELGLSEATVRQRVSRLLKEKTVYITVATNPLELGYLTATVGLKVDAGKDEDVAAALAEMDETDWVAHTAGVFDIAVGLLCRDREELFDILVHRIRGIEGVRDTAMYLHLDVVKNLYGW
jgi:Lrp/AsnC family transcriptional regulator for asnA, asnC and gidA